MGRSNLQSCYKVLIFLFTNRNLEQYSITENISFLYTVSTCVFIKKKSRFFLKSLLQRNCYYQNKPRNMTEWLKFCVQSKRVTQINVYTQIREPPISGP